jgi:endonuclease III
MMQDASKSLKKSTKKTLKEMEPEDAAEFSSGIDTLLSSQTETEAVQAAAELAAMVDPTGVSSTIAAFAWDTCDKMHGTG